MAVERLRSTTLVIQYLIGFVFMLGPGCGGEHSNNIDGISNASAKVGEKFSFFVTSFKALQLLSGNPDGFGGDLRYGETGTGAGLRGADKICVAIAEKSMPGSSAKKQWRAFLSITADENGKQVDAIDRIGNGPWYDRLGRLLAPDKASLLATRPMNGDPTIQNDFPNEDGIPNHDPDLTGPVDNHDFLTGSNAQGRLYGKTATCQDWTTADGSAANGRPRVGHSWPRSGTSMFPTGTDAGFVMPFGNIGNIGNTCGCVDETGACHVGLSTAHCGTGGEACAACATGETCINGVCGVSDGGTTGTTMGFPFGMMGDGGMPPGFPFGMMGDGGMPPGFPFGFMGDGGPMSMESMDNWVSALDESGCGAGSNLSEASIPGMGDSVVGGGGGYGGFYCFALTP
jgi:hypothetical protein